MRRCLRPLLLLCAGIWAGATPLGAQSPPAAPDFSLSITAATDLIEQVSTTRRVDDNDIHISGARTVDEALRWLPGVHVRVGAEGTPRVDVRGFRARHVLLLLDGIPLNGSSDGQFDAALIPTEFIREIKVGFGATSVLYGEGATAGVVELSSAAAAHALNGALDLDIGDSRQRGARVRLSGATRRISLLLAASASRVDGFQLPDSFTRTSIEDGGLRTNSDSERANVFGKVGFVLSDTVSVGTLVAAGGGSYGVPPSTIDDPADRYAQAPRYERVERYRTLTGQISVLYAPSAAVNVRGWGYVNGQDENRVRYDGPTYASIDNPAVSGTFRRRDDAGVRGGAVHGRYDLGAAGVVRTAVNARREQLAAGGVIRDVALGGGTGGEGRGNRGGSASRTYALRSFEDFRYLDVYSAGGEWELRPWRRTAMVLGYAHSWQVRPQGAGSGTSWLAGISQQLSADVALRASLTSRVRFPAIRQLWDEETGNPALRPERVSGAEIAVDRRLGRHWQLSAGGFWMRATDFIERPDQSSPFLNNERYRFTGLELSLTATPLRQLDLRGGYSFLNAVNIAPGAARRALQNRPRHRSTLEARWRLPARFSARAIAYHVADQVTYARRPPLDTLRAHDYLVVDASLRKDLARRYDVTLGVDNVFDRLYEDAYALPGEGRRVRLGIGARF